jgi:PAS domain S-box-containing protein
LFSVTTTQVWDIIKPEQLGYSLLVWVRYFETIAVLFLSFSFCCITLLFRGKEVDIKSAIFTPWKSKDIEVKIVSLLLFTGIIFSLIGFFFNQFWFGPIEEFTHVSIFIVTAIYISIRNYPFDKSENKNIITIFILIVLSFGIIGHLSYLHNFLYQEKIADLSNSIKRVSEFVGNFFLFAVVYFRLSDRLERKRKKITSTIEEVRGLTKIFYKVSEEASRSKYLDFDINLPEIKSDEELKTLSLSMENMIESIKNREDSIQASSQELQVLNEELSATYEELRNLYNDQEKYIKDLKKSKNEFKAEKNKLDAILASIADGISIQDTDYNIVYVNDFYKDNFGDDIIGRKCYEVYERRDDICNGCPVRDAMSTGEVIRTVRQGFDKSGNKLFFDITASPIRNENGEIIAGIELGKDITKRIHLERELKEKIEELNKANVELVKMDKIKTNFVGMASHELRTPLTMIKGYSELLLYEKNDSLDEVSFDMIKNIHMSSERLGGIISDILDVSRIDDDKLHLNKQQNNLAFVIDQVVKDLSHYTSRRKHEIIVESSPDIDLFYFDINRMYQVVSNFIVNAIKYTPDDGTIKIYTDIIPKSKLEEKVRDKEALGQIIEKHVDWIEIITKDNGIGIDPEEQKHIFDRFYEIGSLDAHSSSKSDFLGGGAGLGLSICKGIVEAHDGIVWVHSDGHEEKKRNGSEFHVLIPYLLSEEKEDDQNKKPFIEYDI